MAIDKTANPWYSATGNSKFKIQNSKFKIQNSKFKIQNSKFKIQNSKFKIQNSKFIKTAMTRFQALLMS